MLSADCRFLKEASPVRGHLRFYTIKAGQMEAWREQFETLIPIMAKAGITVRGTWTEEESDVFGWIRTYENNDLDGCEERFYGSEEWKAVMDKTRGHVDKTEITVIDYR